MNIQYTPLLAVLHQTYQISRSEARFRHYLSESLNPTQTDVRYAPLILANPMGKQPVREMVRRLIDMEADRLAEEAVREAERKLSHVIAEFRAALMLVDDLGGGWTNRYTCDFAQRRLANPADLPEPMRQRFWITGVLWSSEEPTPTAIRNAMRVAIHRTAYVLEHGTATNLTSLLQQEGEAMSFAGYPLSPMTPDELEYTRWIHAECAGANDLPTCIAFLYGDPAATSLGLPKLGLPLNAGLTLAMTDAIQATEPSTA